MPFARPPAQKTIVFWLGLMCVLVMAMIVVGGATRLTNSGLSIKDWKPITGAIPPLSHAQWMSEFEKYKLIPEFQAEHADMTLREFEFIYFWEWGHRQLGRIIGLVYALPFFILLARKRLPLGRKLGFWCVLFLIGIQGAIGWWMVHSGLQDDRVSVSQYRLATHLGMAFIILGTLFWMLLDALRGWPVKRAQRGFMGAALLLGAVYLQIIAGAFVAGTKAGHSYNTWPAMDGGFVPSGYFIMTPWWKNMFENVAAIQFNHRVLAYIVLALTLLVFFGFSRVKDRMRNRLAVKTSTALLILVFWQVALGIWALLSVAPLHLALWHQASSIALFVMTVWTVWAARVSPR